jgi:hypothetical protein
MQISEILSGAEDQDRGRWFDLLHPVTGKTTGIALHVAGPDSRRQAEALALMTDELAEAADDSGRVRGTARAVIHRQMLARCILDWKATEDGKPVPFSHEALLRLLTVAWVKAQADAFAAARSVYFQGGADAAA